MVDTSTPFSLVRGRVMRATLLDACGAVVLGPDSKVETDGVITVGFTAKTEAGTAISVTNANNRVCILDEPAPNFTGYDIEVAFCGVNPDLIRLLTGQQMVMNADGTLGVGFRMNTKVDLSGKGFALELWSPVPSGACDSETGQTFGYFLAPFLKGGIIGDFTWQNDAINFTLTGASTKDGTEWGVGPYDVTLDETDAPGPLNLAMDEFDHLHLELVTVAPPEAANGATAVGVAATGATAGIPATLTPANSYAPLNLAGLSAVTASPLTAWTTGQYVLLRDGSTAHWSSSAWVAGPA